MNPKEAKALLFEVAKLRVPSLREDGRWIAPRDQVERLEGHMLDASLARGQAEEAALYMQAAVKDLEDDWDAIEGWQTAMGSGDKTQKAVTAAKRTLRPDLYDGIREGKWLADKLRVQIKRLERDEEACSRVYSMLSGG